VHVDERPQVGPDGVGVRESGLTGNFVPLFLGDEDLDMVVGRVMELFFHGFERRSHDKDVLPPS